MDRVDSRGFNIEQARFIFFEIFKNKKNASYYFIQGIEIY